MNIVQKHSGVLKNLEKLEQTNHSLRRRILGTEKGRVMYNSTILKNILMNDYKVPSVSMSDSTYWVQKWDVWKNIIAYDWIDKKKYVSELFDCDDFAFWFGSRMAGIYHLNTGFVCYGDTYNMDGTKRSGHAFNIIPAYTDGELNWYVYEPIND